MTVRVAAYAPDLMDRSRIAAAAGVAGVELSVVGTPAELASTSGVGLALADLGRLPALDVARALEGARTVGFASHVDRDLLRRARSAGWDLVLARSAFFARLPELLGRSRPETAG